VYVCITRPVTVSSCRSDDRGDHFERPTLLPGMLLKLSEDADEDFVMGDDIVYDVPSDAYVPLWVVSLSAN
jgi:hypothetical protein